MVDWSHEDVFVDYCEVISCLVILTAPIQILKICSDEETNSFSSWMAWVIWVNYFCKNTAC